MQTNKKKTYKMKVQLLVSANPGNKAEAAVRRKYTNNKDEQLREAVQYCLQNNVRGHAALKTGRFNLIKDRETINRRLDGKVKTGEERSYCTIFTAEEELSVVKFLKNKNRACQGLNKAKLTKLFLDILKIRNHMNRKLKGGRKFVKLTPNAKKALEQNKLSRSFWRRFEAKHPSLTSKRQGHVSVNRALSCTREMACDHLDELAEELIDAGIMTNAEQAEHGVWKGNIDTGRIFNCDETPQFVSYGVDGTSAGLVYAGKGDSCQEMVRENRECVTVHPFVSFSGEVAICQVIFAAVGITSQMAPAAAVDKIQHLLISTTDHGVSDQESFLAACTEFDKYLTEKKILRPVVLMADGHGSRFEYEVLQFLLEKQIWLFIGPAFSTSVTQLLDQLNKNLHQQYRRSKDNLFNAFQSINREAFMVILAEIWPLWATQEGLMKAAKRVGITKEALDVNFMQKDKFETAASLIRGEEDTPSTPDPLRIISPDKRKGSAEYYKRKFEQAQQIIHNLSERSLVLEEIPDLLTVKKVKPNPEKASVRVTQVHGSMRAQDVIAKVENIRKEKEKKAEAKKQATEKKEGMKEAFIRCKEKCNCNQKKCSASGLKQCPICKNVLKSNCSKSNCKVDGVKPTMILPASRKDCKVGGRKKLKYDEDEEEDEEDLEDYDDEEEEQEEEYEEEKDDEEEEEEDEDEEDLEDDGEDEEEEQEKEYEEEKDDEEDLVEKKGNDEGDDIEYGMFEIGEGSGMQKMNPDALVPIPIKNVSCGDWVKVIYIGTPFIGKVIPDLVTSKKVKKHVRVRCLKHPYGVRKPQLMEPEDEAADYSKVYQCLETPKLEKVGRVWMWNY